MRRILEFTMNVFVIDYLQSITLLGIRFCGGGKQHLIYTMLMRLVYKDFKNGTWYLLA